MTDTKPRKPLTVAAAQMAVKNNQSNLAMMDRRLAKIRTDHPEAELAVFSELCLLGNNPERREPVPGPATGDLCKLAKKHGLWLLPGTLYETAKAGYYNTAPVIDPAGEFVGAYRKIYPWRPLEKSLAGKEFFVFDIPGRMRLGVCICYDQWFPEVIRQLAWMGAEAVLCPTMTTTPDRKLERVLARANAITNQLYFVGVNGVGEGGNGRSVIFDPEGKKLADADEKTEAVLTAVLDPHTVARVRDAGTLGVCQVLKSFRNDTPAYPVYLHRPRDGFAALGPIRPITKKKHEG